MLTERGSAMLVTCTICTEQFPWLSAREAVPAHPLAPYQQSWSHSETLGPERSVCLSSWPVSALCLAARIDYSAMHTNAHLSTKAIRLHHLRDFWNT